MEARQTTTQVSRQSPAADSSSQSPEPTQTAETRQLHADGVDSQPSRWSSFAKATWRQAQSLAMATARATANATTYAYGAGAQAYSRYQADFAAGTVADQLAAQMQAGQHEEARELIDAVRVQSAASGPVQLQCVDALIALGDYDTALAMCAVPNSRMNPLEKAGRKIQAQTLKHVEEEQRQGQHAQAVSRVQKALQGNSPVSIQIKAAEVYASVGQFYRTLELCTKLIDAPRFGDMGQRERATTYVWRAMAQWCLGHEQEAIVAANEALQVDPDDLRAKLVRGLAQSLGRTATGVGADDIVAQSAATLAPQSAATKTPLRRQVLAGEHDLNAVRNDANSLAEPFVQTGLGICARALGLSDVAIDLLDGVLKEGGTSPSFPLAVAYRALLDLDENKRDIAAQRLRAALQAMPMARGHLYAVAALAWKPGDIGHCTSLIDQALNDDDSFVVGHYVNVSLSLTMATTEALARAKSSLDRLANLAPTSPLRHLALAEYCVATAKQGDPQTKLNAAWSHLSDAVYAGSSPSVAALHQAVVSWLLGQHASHLDAKRENNDTALGYANIAVGAHPKSASPRVLRGQILYAAGEYEQAKADLERAIDLDPSRADAYLELAKVLVRLAALATHMEQRCALAGQAVSRAKIFLSQARPGEDGHSEANLALARACVEMGIYSDAADACTKVVDPRLADEKAELSGTIASLEAEVLASQTNLGDLDGLDKRKAFLMLQKLSLHNGRNPEILVKMATQERSVGALESAELHLATAVEQMHPGDPLRKEARDLLRKVRVEKSAVLNAGKQLYHAGKAVAPLVGSAAQVITDVLAPGEKAVGALGKLMKGLIGVMADSAWEGTSPELRETLQKVIDKAGLAKASSEVRDSDKNDGPDSDGPDSDGSDSDGDTQ